MISVVVAVDDTDATAVVPGSTILVIILALLELAALVVVCAGPEGNGVSVVAVVSVGSGAVDGAVTAVVATNPSG